MAGFNWIAIDPMTRWRRGATLIETRFGCDALATCHGVAIGGVQYQLYLVDPGTYAVSSMQGAEHCT